MSREIDSFQSWTDSLVRELCLIGDRRLKLSVLSERLSVLSVSDTVKVLDEICRGANIKLPMYQDVYFCIIDIDMLTPFLGYMRMSEIYLASQEMGVHSVTRLLSNPPSKKKRYSEYDFVEGRDIDHLTLGEKRSLAKGFVKDTLDRLVYEGDPLVIRNLLNNPRTTERDALKAASKRPNSESVLLEIFRHKKWSSCYSIKRALVKNPYTPTRISLGLVNFMMFQDLREICQDRSIHDEVRTAACELIRKVV